MLNGLSQILSMMQRRASKHSSVVIVRCTGNLWPRTHVEVKRVDNAQFSHFPVHRKILAICHESRLDRSHTTDLAIQFGNKVSHGDIEWLCQNMRHQLADSGQTRSFCCHLIQVQVHRRMICIHFESRYDRSSTAYLPIQFGKETV